MNIDLGSFAFGSNIKSGGGTPSWGTSIGQSSPDYKITRDGAESILIGMLYCSVPLETINLPIGKGGHVYKASERKECQLASLFKKTYINGIQIDYPFVMLLLKEESGSHPGRKSIKYSDKNEYQNGSEHYINQEFIAKARTKLGLSDDACWFVYKIEVRNQDELHFFAVIVDAANNVIYEDSSIRKGIWTRLISDADYIDSSVHIGTFEGIPLQQIFYGAPGTGKSNKIKECTEGDDTVIRTTFHPDTDYSTFVGCYKPTKETIGILSLHKLHELYPDFKNAVSNRPLHRFITKYYNSFRLLTEKEAESVFDKIETPSTVSAEVPKILAAIEELPASQTITYSFIEQAFTKAYVLAWKKMCDISLPATTPFAVIPASTSTLPYSLTGKIGSSLDFDYTPDGATLTDPEKDLLNKVDNFDFPFDGIDNFAELHNKIKVVVKDQPNDNQKDRYRKKITLKADDVRKLYALWESDHDKYGFLIQGLLRKIYEKLREEGKLKKEDEIYKLKDYNGDDVTIEVNDSFKLLGMYDFSSKTVYLFKNNIGDNTDLLCAVYIHEMFHAYFDSLDQYVPEIEEPIVECCTLCFLELFDDKICESYLMDVESKIRSSAICYYGFGAYLYENRSLDWMMLYKNGFNKIKASSDIVNNYNNKFLPIYPFDYEQETMSLLYNILNPQSKTEYDKSAQFLIIEEINRGNCAQIFGDLFQLLDRKAGYSEYPIEPDEDLRKELEKEFTGLKLDIGIQNHINSLFKENYPNGITDKILKGKLLVLPENLYIWATMNTSDQSLFPIDSAFKRRWEWKYIKIKDEEKDWKIDVEHDVKDPTTGLTTTEKYDWWEFLQKINAIIASMTSSADKQLGYFFCKANSDNLISLETFVNKVVFYLWNDVFKDYGFEDSNLFKFNKKDKDGKDTAADLTYPDFFDDKGKVNSDVVLQFVSNVMIWSDDK